MKITFEANIQIGLLLDELKGNFLWDYNADLKTQFLDVKQIDHIDFKRLALDIIPNLYEIVSPDATWANDMEGLIQLISILMISEKLKE